MLAPNKRSRLEAIHRDLLAKRLTSVSLQSCSRKVILTTSLASFYTLLVVSLLIGIDHGTASLETVKKSPLANPFHVLLSKKILRIPLRENQNKSARYLAQQSATIRWHTYSV